MTTTNPAQEDRAKLSFDLGEDDAEASKEAVHRKVRQISQKTGFTATASKRAPANEAVPASREAVAPEAPLRRIRPTTGRTFPFNTKIKPETYEKLRVLADAATAREGRPVGFAEIIERAVESLEGRNPETGKSKAGR